MKKFSKETTVVCGARYLSRTSSSGDLFRAGIAHGTATLTTVRECEDRPRAEGGPVENSCEGCGLAVRVDVTKNLRQLANRVGQRRSVLEQ